MNEESVDISESFGSIDFDGLVNEHVQNGEYKTALFWAEKRLALLSDRPVDHKLAEIAEYLNVLTIAGNWKMIVSYCSRFELHLKHAVFSYYIANAMYNSGNYMDPVKMFTKNQNVNKDATSLSLNVSYTDISHTASAQTMESVKQLDKMMIDRKLESRFMLVLAKSYIQLQNRPLAKKCISECLSGNPYSSEALQIAIDSKLLTDREIKKILSLKSKKTTGAKVMNLLYELRCSKSEPSDRAVYEAFSEDISIKAATANRMYSKGNITEAYNITSEILSEYGYYENCILIHIACLVALRKYSDLFALSHELVETMKDSHITWYAVGCYYYTVEQYSTAKKYLDKATSYNSGFGEGWVAYGHALYYSEEHEQAMNCFLKASRIIEGNFEPLLYVGMEHASSSNNKLAADFIQDAEQVEPSNPIVAHEQATVFYMQEDYLRAEQVYRKAIRQVCKATPRENFSTTLSRPCSEFWEPMLVNMGHTLMKLHRYEEAIEVLRKALSLSRNRAEIWASLGICMGCLGRISDSVDALNEAILLRPGDELIEKALEVVMNQAALFPLDDSLTAPAVLGGEENEENMDFLATCDDNVEPPEVGAAMESDDSAPAKQSLTTPMRTRSQANHNAFCR